ncbi:MAG TPA: ABC transporter permease subunit, partial [Candidatus Cloacimonadota bacterium]|nr:ABC transporter permease subunit [Candidatus Cloacimonadota bacterium]
FNSIQLIWLVYIPVISMGAIARERNTGTIEILLTLPVRMKEIILGKYIYILTVILLSLLLTLPHFLTLLIVGQNIDYGVIFCTYLGLFLSGAVYASISLFCSTLSNNQITAFIISFMICLILFSLEYALIYIPRFILPLFQYLSITWQYASLSKGVLDSRVFIYFFSLITLFLFLSSEYMNSKRSN